MKTFIRPIQINSVVFAHIATSVVSAFVAPLLLGPLITPGLLQSVPTVTTLSVNGSIENIWAYFLVMYALLPIFVCALMYSYSGKALKMHGSARLFGSIVFFLFAMAMLIWFAFLLPPDREYRGTRIRMFIYATSNSHFLLGTIFGSIFSSLSLIAMLFMKYTSSALRSIRM